MSPKLPITVSAADVQARLRGEGSPAPSQSTRQQVTPEDVRARLAAARISPMPVLNAFTTAPLPNTTAGLNPDDDFDGAPMLLHPQHIGRYDRDPRRRRNPKYDEIKESIRIKGILNPITVTRRPGTSSYMVYGGGNTRLAIMTELVAELPDNPLYARFPVVFRRWTSEADILTAHAVENDLRSDVPFADKAATFAELRVEFEKEAGGKLSTNEVRAKAAAAGWHVSRPTVLLYEFTTDRLGRVSDWLTHSCAQMVRDRFNGLAGVLKTLDPSDDVPLADLLTEEVDVHASRLASLPTDLGAELPELDATSLCNALEERIAARLGIAVPALRNMLAIVGTNPKISSEQLRAEANKGLSATVPASRPAMTLAAVEPAATAGRNQEQVVAPTMPTTQAPLAGMLAAVRPTTPMAPVSAASQTPSAVGADGQIDPVTQGALPPELARGSDRVLDPQATTSLALFQAVRHLAASTDNLDLFVQAEAMPLHYFMELPPTGHFAGQQAEVLMARQAGYQMLVLLSGQTDAAIVEAGVIPTDSRWMEAVGARTLGKALGTVGILVSRNGGLLLPAGQLFCLLTEPTQITPALLQALRALGERQKLIPTLLPDWHDPVTRAEVERC